MKRWFLIGVSYHLIVTHITDIQLELGIGI